MEKTINDFSIGLVLWQLFIILLIIAVVYFVIKLYKKITKHIDKNATSK